MSERKLSHRANVEMTSDLKTAIAALAEAKGLSFNAYVRQVLEAQVSLAPPMVP